MLKIWDDWRSIKITLLCTKITAQNYLTVNSNQLKIFNNFNKCKQIKESQRKVEKEIAFCLLIANLLAVFFTTLNMTLCSLQIV